MQVAINNFNSFVEEYYSFNEESGYVLKSNLSGSFAVALEESYLLPVDILSYAKLISSLLAKEQIQKPLPAFGVEDEDEQSQNRGQSQEYAAGRGWFDRTAVLDNQVKKGDSKLTALQKNIQHLMADLSANEFEKAEIEKIVTISDERVQNLKPMGVYLGAKFSAIFPGQSQNRGSQEPEFSDEEEEKIEVEEKEEKEDDGESSLEAQFREAERARRQIEQARDRENRQSRQGQLQWSSDDLRKRAEAVGWIIRFSRTHKRIYYFNTRTGESTFEEPDI
jgi:hypothetical protein